MFRTPAPGAGQETPTSQPKKLPSEIDLLKNKLKDLEQLCQQLKA